MSTFSEVSLIEKYQDFAEYVATEATPEFFRNLMFQKTF